jgi:predicted  nucleic acid-binding Zn-ribbon protein
MSLLAKVFIVIQTVLIMAYLGVSATLYQHRREWRSSYAKLRERYSVMTKRSSEEIKTLQRSLEARAQFISVKDGEVQHLKGLYAGQLQAALEAAKKLLEKQKDLEAARREFEATNASLTATTNTLSKTQERANDLQARLDEANGRRSLAETQVARLVQQNSELQKNLGDLRQSYADTRKTLRDKEFLIAMAEEQGVNFATLLPGPPVPPIDGKVAAVRDDMNPPLVLLTVGSDDKVEKGFHFSIYRGSEFIGQVIVEKVLKDSSGCRVHFVKSGQRILAGDNAATRLQ